MKWLKNLFSLRRLYLMYPSFNLSSMNKIEFIRLEENLKRQLSWKSSSLKFNDQLEDIYKSDSIALKLKRYFIFGLVSIVIYNLICISDYFLMPDFFTKILILRLFIVTPVLIVFLFMIFLPAISKYTDYLAGIVVGILIAQILIIMDMSDYSNISYYNITWFALAPVILNLVIRISFVHAIVYSSFAYIISAILIHTLFNESKEVLYNTNLQFFLITAVSILANYHITKDRRLEFLFKMLTQIYSFNLAESNKELRQLTDLDSLTGLKNRGCFDASIEQEWNSAIRKGEPISLIIIDIDSFKKYNDNYGHQAGDNCLRLISEVIRQYSRRSREICARYGGEEFVVLLPHITLEEAVVLAERIKTNVLDLNIRHEYSGKNPFVTISLGVAQMIPVKESSPVSLIVEADKALYKAKAAGGNIVVAQQNS